MTPDVVVVAGERRLAEHACISVCAGRGMLCLLVYRMRLTVCVYPSVVLVVVSASMRLSAATKQFVAGYPDDNVLHGDGCVPLDCACLLWLPTGHQQQRPNGSAHPPVKHC